MVGQLTPDQKIEGSIPAWQDTEAHIAPGVYELAPVLGSGAEPSLGE